MGWQRSPDTHVGDGGYCMNEDPAVKSGDTHITSEPIPATELDGRGGTFVAALCTSGVYRSRIRWTFDVRRSIANLGASDRTPPLAPRFLVQRPASSASRYSALIAVTGSEMLMIRTLFPK